MQRFAASLSILVVVIIGGVLFGSRPIALAQDATPGVSSAALPPLLQQWVDAINAADAAAIAALYASGGIHEDIPGDARVLGQAGIRNFFAGVMSEFQDLQFGVVSARQSDDLAVLEYRFSATDRQSGKPLNFRGVIIFELELDQIRRSADYYDVATILEQLGLLDMN